jgi:hypothetical protein
MSDLKLTSLRIQNFRGFRDLKINQLGRVNLIVGKNNVGKTSLLEATEFFARGGDARVLMRGLRLRDEDVFHFANAPRTENSFSDLDKDEYAKLVSGIFHDDDVLKTISVESPESSLHARFFFIHQGERLDLIKGGSAPDAELLRHFHERDAFDGSEPTLIVESTEGRRSYVLLNNHYLSEKHRAVFNRGVSSSPVETIYTGRIKDSALSEMWDRVSLTPSEKHVYDAIGIVLPSVDRMTFKASRFSGSVPYVRLAGEERPIPLRRMGEGSERLFLFGLHLANAKDGVLCIDEIETGLHYTTLPDVWRLIFETARALNIQVFATTHSFDAVKAFERVANEHEEEGVLIQLRRRRSDGDIVAVTSEEKELQEALDLNVDPR